MESLPLCEVWFCGSSSHLLRQTGAGTSEVLHVRLGAALPLIQDEVCGHFALQTGDVAMAEVITQVVHLRKQIHIRQCLHLFLISAEEGHTSAVNIKEEVHKKIMKLPFNTSP